VSLQIQCVSSNPSTPPIHGFHFKPNVLNVDLRLIIKHIINGTYTSNSANKTWFQTSWISWGVCKPNVTWIYFDKHKWHKSLNFTHCL